MLNRIPRGKDFWAGVSFMLIAGLAIHFSADLALGTARRMGPRYFPLLAASGLMIVGAVVAIGGLMREGERVGSLALRPFLILVAVLLFALLLRPLGLVLAVFAMVGVASVAGGRVRLVELAILAAGLSAFASLVFVWGLGLPLQLWPV